MTWSYCVPAVVPLISTASVLPAAMLRSPLTVRVPGLTPGERVPPFCTVTVPPSVPLPPRVPPLATVVAPAVLPVTDRVPADTVVVPVAVLLAESVSVPAPVLARVLPPLTTPDQVTAEADCIVAAPASTRLLSIVLLPVMASVVPAPRLTAPLPRLLSPAMLSVPALTVVVPE